jgi:DNA-binding protein H-NS
MNEVAADKQIDLDAFTISELEQLAIRIGQEIARKRAAGRQWLLEHRTRVSEVEAPKYQNPENAAQTWSGKGKQPSWVSEALARGRTLESLRTDDIRPVPRVAPDGAKGRRG